MTSTSSRANGPRHAARGVAEAMTAWVDDPVDPWTAIDTGADSVMAHQRELMGSVTELVTELRKGARK